LPYKLLHGFAKEERCARTDASNWLFRQVSNHLVASLMQAALTVWQTRITVDGIGWLWYVAVHQSQSTKAASRATHSIRLRFGVCAVLEVVYAQGSKQQQPCGGHNHRTWNAYASYSARAALQQQLHAALVHAASSVTNMTCPCCAFPFYRTMPAVGQHPC
jgi:hypothetical protein